MNLHEHAQKNGAECSENNIFNFSLFLTQNWNILWLDAHFLWVVFMILYGVFLVILDYIEIVTR